MCDCVINKKKKKQNYKKIHKKLALLQGLENWRKSQNLIRKKDWRNSNKKSDAFVKKSISFLFYSS